MFPRRYYVDENGHRVLIGLNFEETFEFEALDETIPPIADDGSMAWKNPGEMPVTERELRWLELYTKHANAWSLWTSRGADRASARLDS